MPQGPGLPWSGKNIWEMKIFPGQGKVREFCGWSGTFRKDLESQGKVREFENKWLWQADQKIYAFCSRGEKMYFLLRLSEPISHLIGGYSLRKELAPLGSKFFLLRVTPKFEVIQLAPLN